MSQRLTIAENQNLIRIFDCRETAPRDLSLKYLAANHTFHVACLSPYNPTVTRGLRVEQMTKPRLWSMR